MALDASLIQAVAQLETRGGAASIKGPAGEDSFNLFNIKDFSGKGFRAHDKAEGSNDAYRTYASRDESEQDFVGLLGRRYPEAYAALQTGDAAAFASGLKKGGYATDPNYETKLLGVIDSVRRRGDAVTTAQAVEAGAANVEARKPKDVVQDRLEAEAMAGLDFTAQISRAQESRGQMDEAEAGLRNQEALSAEHARVEAIGFGSALRTARNDPRVMMSMGLLDSALNDEPDPWGDGPRWSEQYAQVFKELNVQDHEAGYLHENAIKGPRHMAAAIGETLNRREQDKVYKDAGDYPAFFAQLTGGMMDPGAWVTSLGVGVAFRGLGIGAVAAARAGRPGLAVAAGFGEEIIGELAYTAAADANGEDLGVADYVTSFATVAGVGLVTARGNYRAAADVAATVRAQEIVDSALRNEPSIRPGESRASAIQRQNETILRAREDNNVTNETAVPTGVRDHIEAEYTNKPAEVEVNSLEVPDKLDAADVSDVDPEAFASDILKTDPQMARVVIEDLLNDQGLPVAKRKSLEDMLASIGPDTSARTLLTTDGQPLKVGGTRWEESDNRDFFREHTIASGKVGGQTVREPVKVKESKGEFTAREVLEGVLAKSEDADVPAYKKWAPLMKYLLARTDGTLLDHVRVNFQLFGDHVEKKLDNGAVAFLKTPYGYAVRTAKFVGIGLNRTNPESHWRGVNGLDDIMDRSNTLTLQTIVHEIVHTMTQNIIAVWEHAEFKNRLNRETIDTLDALDGIRQRLKDSLREDSPEFAKYATTNLHEFVSQLLTDLDTQRALAVLPASPGFGGRFSSMLQQAFSLIRKAIGLGTKHGDTAFDEAVSLFDKFMDLREGAKFVDSSGESTYALPEVNEMATASPVARAGTRQTLAQAMRAHAVSFLQRNPVDVARLKVFTQKIGGMSDGLVLAASKNPILQMVASLVTETTTGAAGRRTTAAMRMHLLDRKFMGDSLNRYESAYGEWKRINGVGVSDDWLSGQSRQQFDRTVYEEILYRREHGVTNPANDPSVRMAADAMQTGPFTRALEAQKAASTLGSGALPVDSVGYVPQALDGRRLAEATAQQIAALTDHLAAKFSTIQGWDAGFSREFAAFYLDRARRRAMGAQGTDVLGEASDNGALIRDTLQSMRDEGYNPTAVSAAIRALSEQDSKRGLGQTKHRLDVGLTDTLPDGTKVLDFYQTDVLRLARRYAKKTAGNVALTEFGIQGATGARYLRDAAQGLHGDELATPAELEAYDRVMAEMLGHPIPGEVVCNPAANLRLLVGLQRLGGVVWNQASETMNMVQHLGFGSMLRAVASLPRMMGEVGRIKRGADPGNHILTSIESAWGGDIGSEAYRMVAPLDAPDGRLNEYSNDAGLVSRLLRGGSHLQSKVTFFRGLMAAQHRAVAEQIVMRSLRMIANADVTPGGVVFRDASNLRALQDMGFTPELVAAIRVELPRIATFDAQGNPTGFDITQLSNVAAQETYVHALHRGVSQIIQGTFVGERNKWLHNDYLKLMLQLRTFGITATEKQWGRLRMREGDGPLKGYGYATGMLLGQMVMASPLYLARVQANSIGREDREKYIRDNTSPFQMIRGLTNYGSLSGVLGDVLDVTAAVGSGLSDDVKDIAGHRGQGTGVSQIIPAVGSVDAALKVVQGRSSTDKALKQLPFSNTIYMLPIINLTKD